MTEGVARRGMGRHHFLHDRLHGKNINKISLHFNFVVYAHIIHRTTELVYKMARAESGFLTVASCPWGPGGEGPGPPPKYFQNYFCSKSIFHRFCSRVPTPPPQSIRGCRVDASHRIWSSGAYTNPHFWAQYFIIWYFFSIPPKFSRSLRSLDCIL